MNSKLSIPIPFGPVGSPRPTSPTSPSPTRSGFWVLFFVIGLLCVGGTNGCVTQRQVKEIVAHSNAAMLSESALPQAEGKPAADWEQEVARIDSFIEAHPGQPATTNPLRLRQALLLTVNRQDHLAAAAFEMIDPAQLHSERDKALYDLHEHLIWWFKTSEESLTQSDLPDAKRALNDFVTVCDRLPPTSAIRGYLEEMRAWIALAWARDVIDASQAKNRLEEGLDRYTNIFTQQEILWMRNPEAEGHELNMDQVRRALRARTVIGQYQHVAAEQQVDPDYANPWVDQVESP